MRKVREGDGFVVISLGDVEVVALRDGHVDMPVTRLRLPGDAQVPEEDRADVPLFGGQLRLSVNAFLVRRNGQSLLIDTGAADAWHPTMGGLYGALERAGIDRAAIGVVALTHTHIDHISGLVMPGGVPAFPEALVFVPEAEIGMFQSEPRMAPVLSRVKALRAGDTPLSGVTAVAAVGHEVGHTAYLVAGSEGSLLIWGDVVHVPSLQFARPDVTWEFDTDQTGARATRLAVLARVAAERIAVAGAHLDFPGMGTVRADGSAFLFTPIG